MSISAQAFTDAGRTMLGRANNGELLTFDTMVIGAGVAASTAALYPLVALIDHRFDVAITAKVDQGNGILVLDGVINSADIPVGQGFNLCELGLMAHIALEAPALYSVANVLATTPDYIPDAVENPTAVHAFKIKVVIDRATNVTVVLGTSIDILAENIGPALDPAGVAWPGVFHEKLANTLRFKRLTPGEGIEITEAPADPFNITIGQKFLALDLDLYVPLTNPGGTPETRFDTIQEAWDSLSDVSIPVDRKATIHVDTGILNITAPMILSHRDGLQITIIGEPSIELPIVTLPTAWVTATANSWTTDVIVADGSMVSVGDIIGWSGWGINSLDGAHQVTGKPDPNTIRFLVRSPHPNLQIAGLAPGTQLWWYPTRLTIDPAIGNNIGVRIMSAGANLQSLAIIDTNTRANATVSIDTGPNTVKMTDVSICQSGSSNLDVRGSTVTAILNNCFLGDGVWGIIIAEGGYASLSGVLVGAMQGIGIWIASGRLFTGNFRAVSCGSSGLTIDSGNMAEISVPPGGNYNITNNVLYGLYCHGGQCRSTNAGYFTANGTDIFAAAAAFVHLSNAGTAPNFTTCDPPINTIRSTTPGTADTSLVMA